MNYCRLSCSVCILMLTLLLIPAYAELIDQKDGTVLDTDSGVHWLKDANLPRQEEDGEDFGIGYVDINPSGAMTWYTATVQTPYGEASYIQRMKNIDYLGFNDWRLPTIEELQNLYTELGGGSGPFNNIQSSGFYWSGTDDSSNSSNALGISFGSGLTFPRNKQWNNHFVWPVRKPQPARRYVPAVPLLLD